MVERGWRWCRRNPAVAGLLGTLAATLVLGATVASFFAVQADRRADQAQASAGEARTAQQAAQHEAAQKDRQRQEAETQWRRAEMEKRLAEHRLFTSQLYRVEVV